MKIISANRSEVFDEYLSIISRYNEKNLAKEASVWQGSKNVPGAANLAARTTEGLSEAASIIGRSSLNNKTVLMRAGLTSFAEAGVRDARHFKDVMKLSSQLKTAGFAIIEESTGKIRVPTPDEIAKIEAHKLANTSTAINATPGGKIFPGEGKKIIQINDAGKALELASDQTAGGVGKGIRGSQKIDNFAKLVDAYMSPSKIKAPADAAAAPGARAAGEAGESLSDAGRGMRQDGSPISIVNKNTNIIQLPPEAAAGLRAAGGTVGGSAVDFSKFVTNKQLKSAMGGLKGYFSSTLTALEERLIKRIEDLETLVKTNNEAAIKAARDAVAEATESLNAKMKELIDTSKETSRELAEQGKKLESLEARVASGEASLAKALQEQKGLVDELRSTKAQLDEALSELRKAKGELANAGSAAARAGAEGAPAITKATAWKSIGKFLWNAALVVGTIAGGYWLYNKLTGEEEDEEVVSSGEGGDEDPRATAAGGEDEIPLDGSGGGRDQLTSYLEDPNKRRELFDKISRMNPEKAEELLQRIARYYGASGYIRLSSPVVVNGEEIEYVFPRSFRGGRDPVRDVARRAVTEEYFNKVYTEDTNNNRRIISRFESATGSSDSQKIANYGFSAVAGGGLFSGKGTFLGLGNRGKRYGKGKENTGVADFGIAGTSQRKMTREERKAVERMGGVSEADDSFSDNIEDYLYNDINDPMQAFASGQEEYFEKKSKNINISTNKTNSYEFAKKADKISNRYFKDAVEDLQDDEFMKAYYAGFSKLHNQKTKKQKPDYEKLYDLHDETGAELIHKAHPKAISVAEAIGNGGLVENESEKSKAMEEVAFRVPSGNYRARYAFIQNALKKKS